MRRQKSKWSEFSKNKSYELRDLGRAAVFLIPEKKLKMRSKKTTVEKRLQEFLSRNFGGFRFSSRSDFGVWVNDQQVIIKEKCREYEVSFPGKRGIELILEELSKIARETGEECIYFKAGQYTCLMYPKS